MSRPAEQVSVVVGEEQGSVHGCGLSDDPGLGRRRVGQTGGGRCTDGFSDRQVVGL